MCAAPQSGLAKRSPAVPAPHTTDLYPTRSARRATVSPRHTFGLKADVKDNVHYLDEQTVLYPAGHNVVIFNIEQKTQRFISGTEKTEGITAIAVSPNKKFVAVAERAAEGACPCILPCDALALSDT